MKFRVLPILLSCAAMSASACKSSPKSFPMKWEVTSKGTCGAPGYEAYAGQTELTLRYVAAPKYFETFCSTTLATKLRTDGKPIVDVKERVGPGRNSYSICEVDGLVANPPTADCAFQGWLSGGYDCVPARDGNCSGPAASNPTPWD